jgi:hypothetical protein
MANHPHHAPNVDKGAAYVGLVGAVIFLLIVVITIVTLTNKKYAHEGGEGTPAAATR